MTPDHVGSYRARLVLVAAALMSTASLVGVWLTPTDQPPEPSSVEAIADALGKPRPAIGRLTLLPSHAPPGRGASRLASSGSPPPSAEFATAVRGWRQIQGAADRSHSSSDLQQIATLDLIAGRPGEAVGALEKATHLSPDNAALWSDLAAAHLEDAVHNDHPYGHVLALAAADRAWQLNPNSLDAAFNLALALTRLHLDGQATQAWNEYLVLAPNDGWRSEAEAFLSESSRPAAVDRWPDEKERLRERARAGDGEEVREIVRDFAARSRELAIGDLLVAWAAAEATGRTEEAARDLDAADLIGQALVAGHSDHLVADGVDGIKTALQQRPGSPALTHLSDGVTAYGTGLALTAKQAYDEAERQFSAAEQAFAAASNPLAGMAAYYRAVCEYYRPDYARAERSLVALLKRTDTERYPSLAALTLRMLGLSRYVDAVPTESLSFYANALVVFRRADLPEETAGAESLVASAYGLLGQLDESWRHRLAALAAMKKISNPRRPVSILGRTGDAIAEAGEPRAALYFHDEAVDVAVQRGATLDRMVALLSRTRVRSQLGDGAGARGDIELAWKNWLDLPEGGNKESGRAEIFRAEGDLSASSDPQTAIASQTKALDYFRTTKKTVYLAEAHAARGRAYLALGDERSAEADYRAAIAEVERQRTEVHGDEPRIDFLALAKRQRMFDDLIALAATRMKEPDLAFDVAELYHARALFEQLIGRNRKSTAGIDYLKPGGGRSSLLDEIQHQLPKKTAFIFYSVLGRRTFAWLVTRSGRMFFEIDIGAEEVTEKVRAFREAICSDDDSVRFRTISGELFDLLVRPALDAFADTDHLVVVPDKALNDAPFAALFDRTSGQYLAERFALSLAPSAEIYLHTLEASHSSDRSLPDSALVIGDPSFDRILFPGFSSLPGSRREAIAIARLYPHSELLVGDLATPERFRQLAGNYDVVQFSGHALVSLEHPSFSALLFASSTSGGETGALVAREIANLDLSGTCLVILAGCNTGVGLTIPGEGTLSLARALLVAGAPAVVQTLWDTDDASAAELFTTFHSLLLAGEEVSKALQLSQLSLLHHQNEQLRKPHTWSGIAIIVG